MDPSQKLKSQPWKAISGSKDTTAKKTSRAEPEFISVTAKPGSAGEVNRTILYDTDVQVSHLSLS
jgi:hypothetical protein